MSEQANNDERTHPEEPAEGAENPGRAVPDREHPQAPAEGPDDESAEEN